MRWLGDQKKLRTKVSGKHIETIKEYRSKIEIEFEELCKQILTILYATAPNKSTISIRSLGGDNPHCSPPP